MNDKIKIYISSTWDDLSTEREKVRDWLINFGFEPVDSYSPDSAPLLESCLTDLETCQLFVLIQGYRYGHRPQNANAENLSITHLEYRHAGCRGIPRIVLKPAGIRNASSINIFDPVDMASVNAFHQEVTSQNGVRPALFNDEKGLLIALQKGINKELKKTGLTPSGTNLHETLRHASQDLLSWPTTLPDGEWMSRPELEELKQRIENSPYSLTLVLGEPGCGKSALLAHLGREMQSAGMPVLGIKADFLPEDTLSQQALTQYLELPYPLLATILSLAEGGPILVLVDQLDALADMVVQHSARLRVLLDLIRDLNHIPNVHVVATCRSYEQQHDPSLRHLEADSLKLNLPTWVTVNAILQAHGVQADSWAQDMRDTLRSPHALDTFLSLLSSTDEPGLVFGFQGMLQIQWEKKVLNDASSRRKEVMLALATQMAERETLLVPLALFEDQLTTIHVLVADGLLRMEEGSGRIHFRHQTLYEFVRAKTFLDETGSLTESVLNSQGSLRIRPQLWHALVYMRRVAPDQYQEELRRLWQAQLRPHLRMLLIEFLGMHTAPLPEEVRLAFSSFDNPWFQPRFINSITGSPGWFDVLAPNHLPMLMARPPEEAEQVHLILSRALDFKQEAVLELIDTYWLPLAKYDKLSWWVLAMSNHAPLDATWVDRLVRILSRSDIIDSWGANDAASKTSVELPNEAPRLIVAWLSRQWSKLCSETKVKEEQSHETEAMARHFSQYRQQARSLLEIHDLYDVPAIAEAAPQVFITAVWPLFIDLLEADSDPPHSVMVGYRKDHLLEDDICDDQELGRERPLLKALALAVTRWAATEPASFVDFATSHQTMDLLHMQRLLAHGLMSVVSQYPAFVLDFLCNDSRRLALGSYSDCHKESKLLIRSLAPHLNASQLYFLEQTIRNWHCYKTSPGDDDAGVRKERFRWEREHRLRLMRSIPQEFRNHELNQFLEQEERAFPDLADYEIRLSICGEIQSSISTDQMQKAQDNDIINLFSELTDENVWDHPRHREKGGAIQAARALAKLAEKDPDRAIGILRRLQPERNEIPAGEVVCSLSEAGYDSNTLFALIEEFATKGFCSEGFHRNIARAVKKAVSNQSPAPQSLLNLLEGWLTLADSASENTITSENADERNESLLFGHGCISFLPSGNFPILAALSKACLILNPPNMDRWLDILESHLDRNEQPSVWAAIAWQYLRWLDMADQERAQAFLNRLFFAYPTILEKEEAVLLMAHLQRWIKPENARRWLELMMQMGGCGLQGSGELLMLRHAFFPTEEWPREQVSLYLSSTDENTKKQRIGISHVLAQLWSEPNHRQLAHNFLLPLLSSCEDEVLKAVGQVFLTKTLFPDQFTRELLDNLCENSALLYDQRAQHLSEHLENLVFSDPERVTRVTNALLDRAGEAMRNIASSWHHNIEPLLTISLKLQEMGPPHREAGLHLFERMLEFNLAQAHDVVVSLDKRTPNAVSPKRPKRRPRIRKSTQG